jgi:uncharacterized protein YbjT (DUF2867 family)
MALFLTGSTGYIGGHIAARLLERPNRGDAERLNVLVRAKDSSDALPASSGARCNCTCSATRLPKRWPRASRFFAAI